MRRLMGEDVPLVNPAYETAIELRGLLAEHGLSRDPFAPFAGEKYQFYVSDLAEKFYRFRKLHITGRCKGNEEDQYRRILKMR